jgi:hypothetical protein
MSWSSGKDRALAFARGPLRRRGRVTGLLTTVNAAARLAMHDVRRVLLEAQAGALGLPLHVVELPWPCRPRRPSCVVTATSEFQGCESMSCGHSNVSSANDFAGSQVGSQVGSQCRQAPADTRLRPAAVLAGSRHVRRRPALPGDGPALYGMQKVRGSNPLSSTLWSSRFCGDHFHV